MVETLRFVRDDGAFFLEEGRIERREIPRFEDFARNGVVLDLEWRQDAEVEVVRRGRRSLTAAVGLSGTAVAEELRWLIGCGQR